jgi:hypothetical protein
VLLPIRDIRPFDVEFLRTSRAIKLALATVDQDQVRQNAAFLLSYTFA